jgi:hypothetical protein
VLREIRGAANHGKTLPVAKRHRDHVLRHAFQQADARVEPFGHDIDQPPFGDDVELHLGIALQECDEDRHHLIRPAHRRIDARSAGRRVAEAAGLLECGTNGRQSGRDAAHELRSGFIV